MGLKPSVMECKARLRGLYRIIYESTAKRAGHRCGAAFAEADSIASHAHACFTMHPSWFVCRVLCALGVSAVRFCSEVIYSKTITSVAACGARVICETSLLCVERSTQGLRLGRRCDHALHLQETFSDVVKTDKTGLSKTAHTRWMISAFANFLPGSTIFRLA